MKIVKKKEEKIEFSVSNGISNCEKKMKMKIVQRKKVGRRQEKRWR